PVTAPLPTSFSSAPLPPTAPPTLSLHDALPILAPEYPVHTASNALGVWRTHLTVPLMRTGVAIGAITIRRSEVRRMVMAPMATQDRKSTRLNSSHLVISYAVFCLKKKKTKHMLR